MPKQVLFIQGGGEGVHDTWDNKLADSLRRELGQQYCVSYPAVPNEADPRYAAWKKALEPRLAELEDGAFVVAHSVGATILITLLAERESGQRLGGVFLVAAPFVGEGGWPSGDIPPMDRLGARLPSGLPVHLYQGSKDETAPVSHLDLYATAIPQAQRTFLPGRDHQLNNDLKEVAEDIRLLSSQR